MYIYKCVYTYIYPFTALIELVRQQQGNPVCKKLCVGLLVATIWLELCKSLELQLSPLTTSITPSSNKIQHGDILVPANPGFAGKWLV